MNVDRIIDGAKLGWAFIAAIRDAVRDMRAGTPPIRVEDLHVGATTEDAVERERAAVEARWPGSTRDTP